MNQLTRVQVYLNPDDVSLVDEIASQIKIKRSQIIREAVAAATNVYVKTIDLLKTSRKPKLTTWLELAGVEKSKSSDLGLRVDEIYNG